MLRQREGRRQGQEVANLLQSFIGPLEQWLDEQIDRRLVRTFFLAPVAIVRLHHSRSGLLLSELGAHILSPVQAPAGTKRLSNLLRSPKWSHTPLERFLWYRADQSLAHLERQDGLALAIWDESVPEKLESIALEGLCPVRSSKAARLKCIKPGYYHPPGGPPVFVPGLQWLTVMLAGMQGPPVLAAMRWWTSRGPLASHRQDETASLLSRCAGTWQRRVVHVFDRGFAGTPWLGELADHQLRFILRWPARYHLADAKGLRPAWRLPGANALRITARSWTCTAASTARPASWRYRSVIPRWRANCGWWFPSRQGTQSLVPVDQRELATVDDAWRVVLAGGDVLADLQDRPRHGESQTLVLGKLAQAAAGQLGLRPPDLPVGPPVPTAAAKHTEKLVP